MLEVSQKVGDVKTECKRPQSLTFQTKIENDRRCESSVKKNIYVAKSPDPLLKMMNVSNTVESLLKTIPPGSPKDSKSLERKCVTPQIQKLKMSHSRHSDVMPRKREIQIQKDHKSSPLKRPDQISLKPSRPSLDSSKLLSEMEPMDISKSSTQGNSWNCIVIDETSKILFQSRNSVGKPVPLPSREGLLVITLMDDDNQKHKIESTFQTSNTLTFSFKLKLSPGWYQLDLYCGETLCAQNSNVLISTRDRILAEKLKCQQKLKMLTVKETDSGAQGTERNLDSQISKLKAKIDLYSLFPKK